MIIIENLACSVLKMPLKVLYGVLKAFDCASRHTVGIPAAQSCVSQRDTLTEEKGERGAAAGSQTKGRIIQVSCFGTPSGLPVCLPKQDTPDPRPITAGLLLRLYEDRCLTPVTYHSIPLILSDRYTAE